MTEPILGGAPTDVATPYTFILPLPKKKCLIVDLNGVLLKRYRTPRGFQPNVDTSKGFIVVDPPKLQRQPHFLYVIRPNMLHFLHTCQQMFDLVLWSSVTRKNMLASITTCWPGLERVFFYRIMSQEGCQQASFTMADVSKVAVSKDSGKPIFLKCLSDFWAVTKGQYHANNTLLVDDSRYKSMQNPWHYCICPTSFDPEDPDQDPNYMMSTLLPWLLRWNAAKDYPKYATKSMIFNSNDNVSSHVIEHYHSLLQPRWK